MSAPGLLREVRACFDDLEDPVPSRGLSLAECLMSGLAVFGLKYPSLLQFDRDARSDEVVRANLRSLYGIERAPSDTALRERLDEVDPRQLRPVFKRVFALLQRGKGLEGFTCLDGHSLLSVDGTGYFSSSSVHCAHCCEKLNDVPLNDTHFELEVNFLEYWETRPNGREQHFAWVTDLPIDDANVMALMGAARARWRIENETFNTLKNQGYCFEHNFGHGKKHLATVFAYLMMLAFLIDQSQQRGCAVFRKARHKAERAGYFWERVRALFLHLPLADWETLYQAIVFGYRGELVVHDTS